MLNSIYHMTIIIFSEIAQIINNVIIEHLHSFSFAITINRMPIHIITLVNSNQDVVFKSRMNTDDAGSFTSAYDFELGNKVKIVGRRQGTLLKKVVPLVICMRSCLTELSS